MLFLDLETYSEHDIKKVSLDRYAGSARILMCAYAGDTGPVEIWEEADGPDALQVLQDRMRLETCVAWNVSFERTLTAKCWKLSGIKWRDAMVDALYAGLPAGLKDCNRVPFFANEAETSKEALLINKFCKPSKSGQLISPREAYPEEWHDFCEYCKADVHDTRLIFQWLQSRYVMPDRVLRAWEIDQAINQRGMPIDRLLTYRAWEEAQRLQAECASDLQTLTGLDNPNSPTQLLKWVTARGYPYTGLAKELVLKALKEEGADIADD